MALRGQVDFLARSQSPTAYRRSPSGPGPSVAARHLPTLWGVTLYTKGPLGLRVGVCEVALADSISARGIVRRRGIVRANNVRPYSPQALGCRGRRPRRPDDYAYVAGGYGIRPYGIHESRGIRGAPASGARAAKTAVG